VTVWKGSADGAGLAVGGGGSGVESARDVAIGRLPRTADDVDRLLRRTVAGRRALARLSPAAATGLRGAILRLAAALDGELAGFTEVELNPLGVGEAGVALLDAVPSAAGGDRGC